MPSPRPRGAALAILAACSGLVLLSLAALGTLYAQIRAPASFAGADFSVAPGVGASSLGAELEKAGIVRSGLAFRLLARITGKERALKAGAYRFEAGMDAAEVLEAIASGRQRLVRVTIPEGLNMGRIASILEREGIAPASEFLAVCRDPAFLAELGLGASSLEGYLFPDTYFFTAGLGARPTARAMVDTFQERVAGLPGASGLDAKELHRRVIMASIVEREYSLAEEAPIIAGVFYNRLKIGMPLQSCATVVYVITEIQGKAHPERLFDRDIAIPDPFNTYVNRGLPPAPIANPGAVALAAAFAPATTPYLYFRLVDQEKGRHYFSATLDQHIRAGALYVKRASGP